MKKWILAVAACAVGGAALADDVVPARVMRIGDAQAMEQTMTLAAQGNKKAQARLAAMTNRDTAGWTAAEFDALARSLEIERGIVQREREMARQIRYEATVAHNGTAPKFAP